MVKGGTVRNEANAPPPSKALRRASKVQDKAALGVELEPLDFDFFEVVEAEFKQGRVAIEVKIGLNCRSFRCFSLALKFIEGKDIQGDRVAAEADFVEGGGIMEQAFLAA